MQNNPNHRLYIVFMARIPPTPTHTHTNSVSHLPPNRSVCRDGIGFFARLDLEQQLSTNTQMCSLRPHYHTITHIKHVTVPVHVPIPAPPAKVINHVVNVPVNDARQGQHNLHFFLPEQNLVAGVNLLTVLGLGVSGLFGHSQTLPQQQFEVMLFALRAVCS